MPSLVEFVATAQAEKARMAASRYEELVVATAEGREVDNEAALLVVEAAKKTAQEFEADVSRLQRIAVLQRIIDTEPEVRRKRQETDERLSAELKEAKAALDAATERHAVASREYNAFTRFPSGLGLQQIVDAKAELQRLVGPPASPQPVQVVPTSSHISFGNAGPNPEGIVPSQPRPFGGSTYRDVPPAAEPMIGMKAGEQEL